MAVRKGEWGHAAKGGVVAGLIAGVVMAAFMLIVAAANGGSGWMALKGPSVPFLGRDVMTPGFAAGPVILGVIIHFAIACFWGVLFSWIAYGMRRGATLAAGLAWGLVVWFCMFYIALPIVGMGDIARAAPVGLSIIEHLVFGLALAAGFLPYQRVRVPLVRGDIERTPVEGPVQRPTRGGRDLEPPRPQL